MTRARDIASGINTRDDSGEAVPHIIPGVLYPAVSGNDINGTDIDTSHGSTYTYGTAHADGRKYYYTDIKGSKPIRDPRIGAHFGSQRHKFKSLQLLEQETATHGKNIYSADGREWVRFGDGNNVWQIDNDGNGAYPIAYTDCTNNFVEITGYFNDINFALGTATNRSADIDISVNGTLSVDGSTTLGGDTTVASPLVSRFVDSGSLINGGSLTANAAGQSGTLSSNLGTTPKINTIKYEIKSGSGVYVALFAIELIAQDTSNRNNIQIPSQNVVSYGKKFTVSGTPHYDPFNGFTNGTSLHSAFVDTATSLGLDTAPGSSAKWAISSTNHIRPYQGGRVVKWVDSDGTIKTSVNMMPPNAQNISTTADSETTTPSATNTNYKPAFSDDAIDHTQSEVAKTFHVREFGNGAGNQGSNPSATPSYQDASMLNSNAAIAYVMDDGLSSWSGTNVCNYAVNNGIGANDGSYVSYVTIIGTGITVKTSPNSGSTVDKTWGLNLPYGTHILKTANASSNGVVLDGVTLLADGTSAEVHTMSEVTIYQPKRPPIPEDACVLADYMLMADFVGMPTSDSGIDKISKGVRACSVSRDVFYEETDGDSSFTLALDVTAMGGYKTDINGSASSDTACTMRLPAFATNYVVRGYQMDTRAALYVGSTEKDSGSLSIKNSASDFGSFARLTSNQDLGIQNWGVNSVDSQAFAIGQFEFVTPIHTSHHYQSFETPFLHELIGGDRNMEQTNLVVSPDGRTWDEVTRDTSYLGKSVLQLSRTNNTGASSSSQWILDECRGVYDNKNLYNKKHFAIAYDEVICLVGGEYRVQIYSHYQNAHLRIKINDTIAANIHGLNTTSANNTIYGTGSGFVIAHLKRGDTISCEGGYSQSSGGHHYMGFIIEKT